MTKLEKLLRKERKLLCKMEDLDFDINHRGNDSPENCARYDRLERKLDRVVTGIRAECKLIIKEMKKK